MKGTRTAAILLAGLLLPACGSDGSGGGWGSSVTVVNTQDTFSATIVGFDYDGTVDRSWSCTESQATLTIGSTMSAGSVDISVYDGATTLVYANSHREIGGLTVQTRPGGVPGTWRVVLDFHDATLSGSIVLQADNSPPDADRVTIASASGTSDNYRFHAEWTNGNVDISIGNVSGGTLTIRLWDALSNPSTDPPTYEATDIAAAFNDTATGAGGTWTIDLDFASSAFASAVSITGD